MLCLSSLLATLAHGNTLVLSHHTLVALNALLSLSASISPHACALLSLPLLFHVDLDDPVVFALLVQGLVSPLALPFAALLIVGQVAALLAGLGLDALLGGEALPLGRWLGLRYGLLSRETSTWLGEREEDAVLGGVKGAGGEELVDEGLGAVAGKLGEGLLQIVAIEVHRVGVLGEEVAEIEGVRRRLFDCDWQLGF